MKTFFLIWRIITGMVATSALLILLAIILLRSGAAFLKESAGVLGYVAALFTSGFTRGTPPRTAGWVVSLPQAGLALLFVGMLVTLFLPGHRILLNLVVALTGVAAFWYLRMLLTVTRLEILCLPALVIWFVYYLVCINWYARQSVPPVIGQNQRTLFLGAVSPNSEPKH